jgi:hypothetical protein
MPLPTTAPVPDKITFSQELRALTERFADRPVRLSAILEATHGRGFNLLLVLISLPFLTPIPVPGLSTLFGLVVAVIGARLALGKNRGCRSGCCSGNCRRASWPGCFGPRAGW